MSVPTLLPALLSACLLAACVPAAMAPAESGDPAGKDQVIVVGRVVLNPPLHPKEQRFKSMTIGVGSLRNRIFLLTGDDPRPLDREPAAADYEDRIEATLGETYFVRTAAKAFFLRGGVIFINDDAPSMNRALFPGGLRFQISADDQAVYVGTIEYRRDEAFNVTGTRIIDDYATARREFEQKFGRNLKLRKSLLAKP